MEQWYMEEKEERDRGEEEGESESYIVINSGTSAHQYIKQLPL